MRLTRNQINGQEAQGEEIKGRVVVLQHIDKSEWKRWQEQEQDLLSMSAMAVMRCEAMAGQTDAFDGDGMSFHVSAFRRV